MHMATGSGIGVHSEIGWLNAMGQPACWGCPIERGEGGSVQAGYCGAPPVSSVMSLV